MIPYGHIIKTCTLFQTLKKLLFFAVNTTFNCIFMHLLHKHYVTLNSSSILANVQQGLQAHVVKTQVMAYMPYITYKPQNHKHDFRKI